MLPRLSLYLWEQLSLEIYFQACHS
ncbi:hypothetical protein HBJ16_001406, partial [Pseudomonas sp. CES]